ncbi:MAG: AbrB/MazE/SpoVT family DNA-binding domain-containing protein [Ignavibacteriales bacterium]|nr:AbrB/MazE/SpoVT family DNA-binding domain-containing protein [Ignavibacteriales bacterium]
MIPAEVRRKFKMKAGTKVAFIDADDGVVVRVINKNYFDGLAGALGLKGKHLKSLMVTGHTPAFACGKSCPLSRGECFMMSLSF